MMTREESTRAHNATCCAGCGAAKPVGQPLCTACLRVLPNHMRSDVLFTKRNEGLERKLEEAIRCAKQRRMTASEVGAGQHTRRL